MYEKLIVKSIGFVGGAIAGFIVAKSIVELADSNDSKQLVQDLDQSVLDEMLDA